MSEEYIYIVCGGSGGHIMPGLGFYRVLSKFSNYKVILVGVRRKENKRIFKEYYSNYKDSNLECIFLPDIRCRTTFLYNKKFSILSLKKVVYMIKLFLMFFYSFKYFMKKKPKAVIGFGSYAAFPMVFLGALWKNVTTIIHEQNIEMGKANKFLTPLADDIFLSFKESLNYFKKEKDGILFRIYKNFFHFFLRNSNIEKKITVTGNPGVLRFIEGNKRKENDKFNILILGGSQGARIINKMVPEAIVSMRGKILRGLKVYHMAGDVNVNVIKSNYEMKTKGLKYQVFKFNFEIEKLYKKADLVISRAGATTISEIKFFKLASIIIPYEHAKGHQLENSDLLSRFSAAVILREDRCNKNILKQSVKELISNSAKRKKIVSNLGNIGLPDPKEEFVTVMRNYNFWKD